MREETTKVRVYWDSPDYYQLPEDTYEDIEVDDSAIEEEIEKAVKETAFEHFEYSYEIYLEDELVEVSCIDYEPK